MKIIISKTFEKKYLQKLYKYFDVNKFVDKLNKSSNIILKYPHFKIKLKINLVDFRWIILIQNWKYIIPIILCLKKDKNCGENIIWSKIKKEVLSIEKQVLIDIENKDYEIY